jgi:exosome complex component CSL4
MGEERPSSSSSIGMAQAISIAVPGQFLGPTAEVQPGPGTHIHDRKLYASILGPITTTVPPKPAGPQKRLTKIIPVAPIPLPTVSIQRDIAAASSNGGGAKGRAEVLPEVNSSVLCRVTRITPKQATVAILVVGETVLDGEWQGLIRVQDVRATEKDRVKVFESFRPGDIVRAVVVCWQCGRPRISVNRFCRSPWATSRITTSLPRAITWALSWLPARLATQCTLFPGRSTETRRPVQVRTGRLRSLSRHTFSRRRLVFAA